MPSKIRARVVSLKARVPLVRFFLKITVWFWCTALILLILAWLGFMSTGLKSVTAPNMYATVAPILATQAIESFEKNGPDGFRHFIQDNPNGPGTSLYLLDGNYRDVLGRDVEDEGMRTAQAARLGQLVIYRGNIAAYRAVSSKGMPYILLLYMRGGLSEITHFLTGPGAPFAAIMFAAVLILSLWLAYHIASPVHELQNAARRVAEGDLTTRVPKSITQRRDELAVLGVDFDSMVGRLELLIQSQKDLLSAVSHEVRSPLTRMNLSLGLLRRRAGNEYNDLLDRLDAEIQRIDRLVGQLLLLSRYEANLSSSDRETVDLIELLSEVIADANFEASNTRKSVEFTYGETILLPNVDPNAIRSAVENVVRNAVRATRIGTTVEVSTDYNSSSEHKHCCVAIRDHGAGVPEEQLTEIFKPFTQLEIEGQMPGGNGLGLAITQEAMRMHGGSVEARNHAGGGLQIILTFPLDTPRN